MSIYVKKTGWANVHMDMTTKQLIISNKPYPSKLEANKGFIWGAGIQKVGTFELEWEEYYAVDSTQTGEV
jgi:hypothetical protein